MDAAEENSLEEETSWNKAYVPVSFSVGCNMDGVETCHVSSEYPGELVSLLIFCLKWLKRNTGLLLDALNIFLNN